MSQPVYTQAVAQPVYTQAVAYAQPMYAQPVYAQPYAAAVPYAAYARPYAAVPALGLGGLGGKGALLGRK